MDQWAGVVLAAGQGQRMKSSLSKPLHRVCGKEMVRYPVDLLKGLGVVRIVVVASPSNAQQIRSALGADAEVVVQPEPLGTGDAVARASNILDGQASHILVQGADAPLIRLESVKEQMKLHLAESHSMTVLSANAPSAQDMGRIQRNGKGQITSIVESVEADLGPDQTAEVNAGVYCFDGPWLWKNVAGIEPRKGGERYLTALMELAAGQGGSIGSANAADAVETLGVNDRVQLAAVEAEQRRRICESWMLAGVTVTDPGTVYIDAAVTIGQDTVIFPNTMLSGSTIIGTECQIGPNTTISDSSVGNRCRITASALESATMEDDVDMGPFSHLRPGAYLESGVHIGNYVEVKESRFARGAVMGHFGYIGDASIGAAANLGAGLVTCNYDGKDKHRTVIGDGAFIGCDTMLVAPVTVGDNAITGAGAVVITDVPAGRLAVGVPAKIQDGNTKSG
ncbi:MAG: UDP-N-acetylglucosamine diphosphorylase/glucosamine-1-phosphate N-acetyltransferase [SAR202 cluster bacterium Io17-Chloro-G9]|nr:MAG: UDP-N-acetylglucosamine diphosphorylase/glucosamine-1-phosphate N-acetyltransferase [SAR202 cluster bacterium Io17-Chloro-G9]